MTIDERAATEAPGWPPTASDGAAPIRRTIRRLSAGPPSLWPVYLLVVTLVVFQRFVVPGTKISIVLPVTLAVAVALAVRGLLVADVRRTLLYLAAIGACLLANLASTVVEATQLSLGSLLLLVVLYVPYCLRLRSDVQRRYLEVFDFFLRLIVVAAAACLLQWAAQMAGWAYEDLLGGLPPGLTYVDTVDFNVSYPIYYGSSIYKSNGVVFLEPSFASQFLALAIILQILRGGGRWRVVLFGGALLTTLSGTGMILLGAGLAALAVRRGGRWAARAALAAGAVVLVISFTPAAELLGERASETSSQGSSGNTRFITPYVNVLDAVARDENTLFVGRGAGSVTRDEEFFNPNGVLVNYTALPKLVSEYGLPATLVFLTFIMTTFWARVPSPTLSFASCMLFLVLSGALLQPPIVYLCWLLTGLFALAPPRSPCPPSRSRPGSRSLHMIRSRQ